MLRYETGTGCALARGGAVVLLRPNSEHDLVMRLWEQLGEDAGLVEVLQVLTGAFGPSLRTVPPFASVVVMDRKVHVAVRGEMSVSLDVEANGRLERVHVDGMDVTTWSERVVDNVADLAVRLGVARPTGAMLADEVLPLGVGVVRADALGWRLVELPPMTQSDEDDDASEGDHVRVSAPLAERTSAPAPMAAYPSAAPSAERSRRRSQPQTPARPVVAVEAPAPVVEKTVREVAPEPVAALARTADSDVAGDDYGHLWGSTVLRAIEGAGARADDEPVAPKPAAPKPPRPLPAAEPEVLVAEPVVEPEPEPVVVASAENHDGQTVLSNKLAELRTAVEHEIPAAAPAVAADPISPNGKGQHILARTCANGHANPPSREACAVCGVILEGDADLALRPALGRIVVSTGDVIELDRGVIVGRRPRALRGTAGETPRLVTVPSPQQDISRSHVEVRLEGWHVLVSDMNTTNGTTLLRVGQPPRRLHPSEPVLVVDGDVADLGDGVTLTFEGLR